jgi:hypothetical protein
MRVNTTHHPPAFSRDVVLAITDAFTASRITWEPLGGGRENLL